MSQSHLNPAEARLDAFAAEMVTRKLREFGYPVNQKSKLISFYTINFRNIGMPFNPTVTTEEDSAENLTMLRKAAPDIAYEYVMGMNNSRITIKRN